MDFWNHPYPMYSGKRWHIAVISSLIVLFILVVFKPFGIGTQPLYICFGYALVSAVCVLIGAYSFPAIFKGFYVAERWTFGRELISLFFNTLLFITIGNVLFTLLLFDFTGMDALQWFCFFLQTYSITAIVGVFPAMFTFFINRNKMLVERLKEANEMNNELAARKVCNESITSTNNDTVVLSGSTKGSITISPASLLYIEAYGNYVKVNYIEEGKAVQKLLRATIKQAEEMLEQYTYIIRCHRAFLINTKSVDTVLGNSQGYRLSFGHSTEEVPVSRAYTKSLRDNLSSI
jgi:Response regulator of the LytR/AlgR family